MTTKQDFTTEEWNVLTLAPVNAATYVMTADMSVVGAFREMKALGKALEHPTPPENARGLVNALLAEVRAKSQNKEKLEAPQAEEGADPREPARQGLQRAAAIVDAQCSPEEAAGFKQWISDIAQTVAAADKEGSHFGIGGTRISDKEKEALAEIDAMLGR